MSEAPAIGLGIVLVAIVAALAAGADSSGGGTGGSSASDAPAAAGTTSTGSCTSLDTVASDDGGSYVQFPVSRSNSLACTLGPGDRGETVAALQRALALCMHQKVTADGVYGSQTARAVRALGGAEGEYGPAVAKRMTWPWLSASSRSFTGRCSSATTSA
jgi:peptidoglycan hydrolase-like protein with peptidoglycan-binding domain